MTCSDVQQLLPELLDGTPDAAFQIAFDNHVKSCPDCSDLVSDLKLITAEARELVETDEPAPRVWLQIAAQLRSEGLIREPETVPGRPVLVRSSTARRWSPWWLVPVAAAFLAAGSYVVSHRATPEVAKQQAPATPTNSAATVDAKTTETPAVTLPSAATPQQLAEKSAKTSEPAERVMAAPPSAEDQQFLSVVSTLAPSARASYENELQAVNTDIRETQAYVNQNPGDADARQHLMDAFQQKALLYQIALDRIQ